MMRYLYLMCILFTWLSITAQHSNYDILQKINQALTPEEIILEYNTRLVYFENINNNKPSTSMNVSTIIGKGYYWLKLDSYEFFGDGSWHCMLDHQGKTITLTKESIHQVPGIDLASFIKLAEEQGLLLQTFDPGGKHKGLRFEAPEHSNSRIDMVYDPGNFYLKTALIKIDVDNPDVQLEMNHCRIEIEYGNYKVIKGGFPYSLSHYVNKTGERFEPARDYAGYQFQTH